MESIGTQLRAAREAKGISLSAAAAETRIKIQRLEAMERSDFSTMPAPAYARGFLKMYGEYLGLAVEPLVQAYNDLSGGGGPGPEPVVSFPPRAAPAEAADPAEGGQAGPAVDRRRLWRVAEAVVAVVLGVLLLTGLGRLLAGGCTGSAGGGHPGRADTLRVADPPDIYLDVTAGEDRP